MGFEHVGNQLVDKFLSTLATLHDGRCFTKGQKDFEFTNCLRETTIRSCTSSLIKSG